MACIISEQLDRDFQTIGDSFKFDAIKPPILFACLEFKVFSRLNARRVC